MLSTDKVIYTSPAMTIGKHEWRILVFERENCVLQVIPDVIIGTGRYTQYQWMRGNQWVDSTEWPTYDFNKSTDGIPAGTARLYYKHEAEIKTALNKSQPTLF